MLSWNVFFNLIIDWQSQAIIFPYHLKCEKTNAVIKIELNWYWCCTYEWYLGRTQYFVQFDDIYKTALVSGFQWQLIESLKTKAFTENWKIMLSSIKNIFNQLVKRKQTCFSNQILLYFYAYNLTWRSTMSSPRTGILSLIRFNSEQDSEV